MYTDQIVLSDIKKMEAAEGYGSASVVKMRNTYTIVA
jgi:hypothetical protein